MRARRTGHSRAHEEEAVGAKAHQRVSAGGGVGGRGFGPPVYLGVGLVSWLPIMNRALHIL